ncbi:MAG: calcium-binding protein, partial [Armatimonadetes bacterium]|nr:calcium-binding protein [Armatimonadota bacterium]
GTVTINPATVPTINVGGIDFAVTGYTIATAASKSLTFATNSNVSVASGTTANISGVISGANGFNKIILGELVLSGTNTYAGATTVTSGKLSVNGSTAAGSAVTVNTGARLGGTGTVNGLVTTAGTGGIDAGLTGATAGTLLVTNALTLANTSTFAAQLGGTAAGDGVGFYDRVTAGSSVVLGGATLDVTLNGFLPAVNDQFIIIDKTSPGAVTGTFNALAEGQQFVVSGTTFQISYVGGDGNDVVLTAITAASNSAPTALNLSPTTIAENAGPNATVGTFTTTDPNSGDTFTYTLVTGAGSTDNALFNISGNTLRATNSLDFETQQAYSIRARTTDAGGQFVENIFTITATDVTEFGVTITPTTGLITTEAGGTATFTIVLNTQPTANVTIPLSSSDTTEGSVSPTSVTFTPANWNTPQTVTVTGADDVIVDGAVAYSVITGAATSADVNYNGFNAVDVAVSNSDNDAAGITVIPTTGLTTTEAGGTATFTIVLNMQPTGSVTIPLSSSDTTEGNVTPTSVTFTTANWNVAQTVTVTGVDDAIMDGSIAYTVVTSAATSTDVAYSGLNAADVSVSNTDNETVTSAGITVTPTTGLTTTEAGGTATFTIVLNTQPTASVTIPLSSSDATEGSVSP